MSPADDHEPARWAADVKRLTLIAELLADVPGAPRPVLAEALRTIADRVARGWVRT